MIQSTVNILRQCAFLLFIVSLKMNSMTLDSSTNPNIKFVRLTKYGSRSAHDYYCYLRVCWSVAMFKETLIIAVLYCKAFE